MSSLALCMVVKDEIQRLAGCLEPLIDGVDEVVIVDNGSTDGTQAMLEQRFGITPLPGKAQSPRCLGLTELRNHAFAQCNSDWILSIDADERLAPDAMRVVREAIRDDAPAGYFGTWINHVDGEPEFEDYKLFLFRRGLAKRGLVHENAQIDLRDRGLGAAWLPGLEVRHFPEPEKLAGKSLRYRQCLEYAVAQEPGWLRYHWFLGYMDYQQGDWDAAERLFSIVVDAQPMRFPVECLNCYMVLSEIAARRGKRTLLLGLLDEALGFYSRVADDFEVAINFRLHPWLSSARDSARAGRLQEIRAYRFAR